MKADIYKHTQLYVQILSKCLLSTAIELIIVKTFVLRDICTRLHYTVSVCCKKNISNDSLMHLNFSWKVKSINTIFHEKKYPLYIVTYAQTVSFSFLCTNCCAIAMIKGAYFNAEKFWHMNCFSLLLFEATTSLSNRSCWHIIAFYTVKY